MNEKKISWSAFLPAEPLPDTGNKTLAVGQVWATYVSYQRAVVRRVVSVESDGYAHLEVLAGDPDYPKFMHGKSHAAQYSQLIVDADEEVVTEKPPRYLEVINRILVKGDAHYRAGRSGQFSQVFVPKDDYKSLVEYFRDDEPTIRTACGFVSVFPINPDGATFTD